LQIRNLINRVADLTDPENNVLYNFSLEDARAILKTGDIEKVRQIEGQYALAAVDGETIYLARSMDRPLRYFIAKLVDGPMLVVADRIDTIYDFLKEHKLHDQFHPSYTRMAPAHYVTELSLVGCPDPNPIYHRFFDPPMSHLEPDIAAIGRAYIEAAYREVERWLTNTAKEGPIGICFSGGIDSGAVFMLTYHALLQLGESPSRLKAFTLSVDGGGEDLEQARKFLEANKLGLFLEAIEVKRDDINWKDTIRITEDYKALDIEAASMGLALCRGIRKRYPDWQFLADGDGGDENLKDYPIEENPELTIRSVLNNLMLYQEGWGVDSIKHSLTYSGGLSRSYTRTYAPSSSLGFQGFSPFTMPSVIAVAEGIPFIELTDWQHEKLYDLKGAIVSAGINAVTGMDMPVFPKRRFQHGAADHETFSDRFEENAVTYRKFFNAMYE